MKELNEIMDEIEARKNLCKERLNGASADETIYNLAAIDMANSIQEAIKIYMESEDDLSIEPEYGHYFTDSEYRLLLTAIDRESKVCRENDEANKDYYLSRIMTGIRRKIRRVQYEKIWVPYQKNGGWILVEEQGLPKEEGVYDLTIMDGRGIPDSVRWQFLKGTYLSGEQHYVDGKHYWADNYRGNPINKFLSERVIAWRKKPEPYIPEGSVKNDFC